MTTILEETDFNKIAKKASEISSSFDLLIHNFLIILYEFMKKNWV